MKRELKVPLLFRPAATSTHRKAHPDEKGTESQGTDSGSVGVQWIARPIPMKRELKVHQEPQGLQGSHKIARPIPMKRELKDHNGCACYLTFWVYRKAHPDEKGTESMLPLNCRSPFLVDRKAHPDEKGTERLKDYKRMQREIQIARPIPMKRELKVKHSKCAHVKSS